MNSRSTRQMRRAQRFVPVATRERQRGAAAVFAAVASVAAIISMLLGINIGLLYYSQRDLQKMATMAALAGVQVSSGCRNAGTPGNTAGVTDVVTQLIESNGRLSKPDAQALMTNLNGPPPVQLGQIVPSAGLNTFVALSDGNPAINAVRVNLSRPAPTIIGGSLFGGGTSVILKASATAKQQPLGAFAIGSTLASLNTAQSMLNPLLSALLGTSVNLSAIDYQGLAQTQISLANLMVAANVTDLNSLLSTSTSDNLSQLQALLATATNTVNPSVANLITGLTLGSTQASTTVGGLAQVLGNLGTALNPTVTDAASQVPFIDALDLLIALGEAAAAKNGTTIQLPISVNIPGLLNTYVFLQVLQPPQTSALGPVGTSAQTAQIVLQVRTNVGTGGILGVIGGLAQATVNLGLDVSVATAQGTIATLDCPLDKTSNPTVSPSATVAVNTGVVKLKLGTFVGNPQSNPQISQTKQPLLNVTLFGAPILYVNVIQPVGPISLGVGSGTTGQFVTYKMPPTLVPGTTHDYQYPACNSLPTTQNPCYNPNPPPQTIVDPSNPQTPVASANIGAGINSLIASLTNNNNLDVQVIGIGLGPLVDPILAALNTALLTPVTSLVDNLLNQLFAALGVQVGSGTVIWNLFETGQPAIVTTALPPWS